MVKNWLKPKLVYYIQVFIKLANFYQYFIQDFIKIGTLLTLILKIFLLSLIRNNEIKKTSDKNSGSSSRLFKKLANKKN